MTVLPPDADRMAHLVRVGERLLAADVQIAGASARAAMLGAPDVAAMRRASMDEASAALDGAYGTSRDTAALLRALAEQCTIEAGEIMGSGDERPGLYATAHLLRRAVLELQKALSARERRETWHGITVVPTTVRVEHPWHPSMEAAE